MRLTISFGISPTKTSIGHPVSECILGRSPTLRMHFLHIGTCQSQRPQKSCPQYSQSVGSSSSTSVMFALPHVQHMAIGINDLPPNLVTMFCRPDPCLWKSFTKRSTN